MKIIEFININKEKWVKVNSFIRDVLSKYEISDHGRVRINGERIMKNQVYDRYEIIGLNHNDSTRHTYYIHRLVAMAFIDNDNPNKTEVNHKEGKLKTWNHVDNLEWTTPRENKDHAIENNLYSIGTNHHKNKYSEDFIRRVCHLLELGLKTRFILKELSVMNGTKEYNRIKRLIKHISMKNQWTHISKDYEF